jgi:hypothetical protein
VGWARLRDLVVLMNENLGLAGFIRIIAECCGAGGSGRNLPAGADPRVIPDSSAAGMERTLQIFVERIATIGQGVAATNCIEAEFMQDRSPVGGGPSSRTWPR